MSEGIYIGLNGGTKRLANELWGVPFGVSSYILGRFLTEIWKPSAVYEKKELELAERVVKEMINEWKRHGHSGGSACVETQNLISIMGCGGVSKKEMDYFIPKDVEKVVNVWSLNKRGKSKV